MANFDKKLHFCILTKKNDMEFRRWGSLAPQKHTPDPTSFHRAPVEYGFYAFPKGIIERFLLGGGFGNIMNGRYSYVRDAKGGKVLMTLSEFDSLFEFPVHDKNKDKAILLAPDAGNIIHDKNGIILWTPEKWKTIEGMSIYDLSLCRRKGALVFRGIDEDDEDNHDFDPQQPYPLVKENKKPTKFEYKGDIWHHLEWTDPRYYYQSHYPGRNEYDPDLNNKYKHLVRPEDVIRRSGSWIFTDMKTYKKALTQALNIFKYTVFMEGKRKYNEHVGGRPGGVPNNQYSWDDYEVFIEKV